MLSCSQRRGRSARTILSVLAASLLASCASEAPPLPPDTTSINRTHDLSLNDFTPAARVMSCDDIAAEKRKIGDGLRAANEAVEKNRTRNEVAMGIFSMGGLIAAPALLATENNDSDKDEIAKLYERQDTLTKLASLKHCPASRS